MGAAFHQFINWEILQAHPTEKDASARSGKKYVHFFLNIGVIIAADAHVVLEEVEFPPA